MIKTRKTIYLLIVLSFCVFFTKAQEDDFQIWSGFKIQKDFGKKLSVSVEEELRLHENASRVKKYFTQLGLSYELSKKIDVGFSYRYINQYNLKDFHTKRNYFYFNLAFREKFKRFDFKLRNRFVLKQFISSGNEFSNTPSNYYRPLFEIAYNIRKFPLDPALAYEGFITLDNPYGNTINKHRITLSTNYRINKKQRISFFYRLDKEVNIVNPVNAYIFGIGYRIKI